MIQDLKARTFDSTTGRASPSLGDIESAACARTQCHQHRPAHDQVSASTRGTGTETGEAMRSVGFYGGIALAVALGVMDPPAAMVVSVSRLLKTIVQPHAPADSAMTQLLEGAATPFGFDAVVPVATQVARPLAGRGVRSLVGQALAEAHGIWAEANELREHVS